MSDPLVAIVVAVVFAVLLIMALMGSESKYQG